jgi:uncharacterized BrkB/YihY/UPF0761 family membrane protein
MEGISNKGQQVAGLTGAINIIIMSLIHQHRAFFTAQYKYLPLIIILFLLSLQFVIIYLVSPKERRLPLLMMPLTLLIFFIITLIWK